ncbi:MAG: UDP-glucuronic acid decarboxylase family protein [Reyranellaceae bacterium]
MSFQARVVRVSPASRSSTGSAFAVPLGHGKTIAVTGGAGFLGSHLCETLIAQGHRVVAIDNFHTGRRANVERLFGSGRFALVDHDIVAPLPAGLPRFDEIYNLACPASPVHYQADPVRTALICATGTYTLLERAAADGARFFHASTSEVYGDPEMHPQPEGYNGNVNPIGPRSCYDEGKRFAETLITDYARRAGLTARIVRIFNTYGPRMQPDDGRVVSNFVIQALRGDDITIYGDGSQTRSFCYVDDLIDGFLRLMAAGEEVKGPVNIGNPAEITVGELAERVIALTGSRSRIAYRPLPVDDPRRRRPDISQARALLGWSPKVALADGLTRTIAHFDGLLAGDGLEAAMRERRFATA